MVESTNQGDGVRRDIIYAKWRDDLHAEPGYTKELVNIELDPKYYDNLDTIPNHIPECLTFLDYFERNIRLRRDNPFLGTRAKLNEK